MTTGRINQIAIPTDEPEDKSVAMKQAPFLSDLRKETLSDLRKETKRKELLGALYKGEQSRVTVSLSVQREGPSTGPRRRGITGLPQWSALPSQSIAKDQPSNTSRPQSRKGPKQRPTLTTTQWTPRGRPTVRGDSRSTTWLPEMGLRCVLNDWDSY